MRLQFVSVQLHVNDETVVRATAREGVAIVEIETGQGNVTIAAENAAALHDFLTAAALKVEQAAGASVAAVVAPAMREAEESFLNGILENAERAGHGLTQRAVDAGMSQEMADFMGQVYGVIDGLEATLGRMPRYREVHAEAVRLGLIEATPRPEGAS